LAKKWRSLVVGSVAISHFFFFLPQCAFTTAMRVQREPPSVVLVLVRVLVRSRSFSFSFSYSFAFSFVLVLVLVRSRSLALSLSLRLPAALLPRALAKVQSRRLWSFARAGCCFRLLGARLSSGISLISIHAFLVLCRDWVFQQYNN
jgi:hypothetical protein